MADKRISQLVDRGTVANNDVVPIVVSGATTTNKATISSIQTFMQGNLDLGVTSVGITLGSTGTDVNVTGSPVTSSGNITINFPTASATNRGLLSSANWTTFNNKVSSVGLSMPSAFAVANSPITGSGTIAVTGAGTVAQYIRGDGSLADFPEGGGGGASVSYYLNGSVSQGTIGGIAYYEMNKVPVLGAGTDFVAIADGYLASFITDAGDPALLEIPAGNWNFETYFSASSAGGTPTFYIELYKVNSGGTATLIASNSATPELIAFGTVINPYFSTLAVPTTVLTITDRLALRYYVARSGRTITLHTENSHLCQIITTFTTGLTALNGLTAQVQNFTTGTSGTDFGISSSVSTHTFNLPNASVTARGVVTTGTQTFAGIKNFSNTIVVNQDLQLAATGTASTTFIKNINGAGLTSIGSNGFGFNNSDNIYFSGSNKAGGVFAFNNTGNRTYTLPDATGTLAFTSDLSGYLPLTGGTLSNNLFITGGGLQVSGSASANRQVVELYTSSTVSRLAASYVGSSSYGDLELLTGGLARLTIAAGGATTLTGALNGTSAVFSGSVTKAGSIFTTNDSVFDTAGSITRHSVVGLVLRGVTSSVFDLALYSANGTAMLTNPAGSTNLNFNPGCNVGVGGTLGVTGAATFSSSVRLGGTLFANTQLNNTVLSSSDATNIANGFNLLGSNSFWGIRTLTGGNFSLDVFNNNSPKSALYISNTGNVGIGTATPNGPLDIVVGAGGARRLLVNYDDSLVTIKGSAANAQPEVLRLIGDGIRFNSGSSGSGTEIARITANGLTFNGDTAAANALDDYEEGTWTPTITASIVNPNVNYTLQIGFYTKIGRQVFIQGIIGLSVITGGSGVVQISGLPFVPSNVNQNFSVGTVGQMSNFSSSFGNSDGQLIVLRANQNSSFLSWFESNTTTGIDWTVGNLSNNFLARFTISYFV